MLDRVPMYKDYMAGKCRDEVDTSPRTCIHALLRGQSKRVDCLLDWLVRASRTRLGVIAEPEI